MVDSEDKKKYQPLGEYLAAVPESQTAVTLTFRKVERIIGDTLPPSATDHREWWANQEVGPQGPHWLKAGFKVAEVDRARRIVRFERSPPARFVPRMMTLEEVAAELNERAAGHPIGGLPEWRKRNKGISRVPSSLFVGGSNGRHYMIHFGGRSELQFNIGYNDLPNGKKGFRAGVAFSFDPSRSLPDVTVLLPKVERFNEFIRIYPDAFQDLAMWHDSPDNHRTINPQISPIPDEWTKRNNFVFVGRLYPTNAIDVHQILDDFDRLFAMYQFVEGDEAFPARVAEGERKGRPFTWPRETDESERPSETSYARPEKTVSVALRHNEVQAALLAHLRKVHGADNATKELKTADRTSIDVAVRDGASYTYYEIKIYSSAQACVREAIGQLLEYSLWPGAQEAARLVIVGEPPLDSKAKEYLRRLKQGFSLPIEYRQFDMEIRRLV